MKWLFFFGVLLPLLETHAIYLAVVQIDHRELNSDTQILVKVFTNDLQDAIRAAYPAKFQVSGNDNFCSVNKGSIESYFRSRLVCEINGRPATLAFVAGTRENDVYWLKFVMHAPDNWQTVRIDASFFMEIFSTQSNIIQVLNGSEKRFTRLTKDAHQMTFKF